MSQNRQYPIFLSVQVKNVCCNQWLLCFSDALDDDDDNDGLLDNEDDDDDGDGIPDDEVYYLRHFYN